MNGPTRSRREGARDDLGFWHGVLVVVPVAASLWVVLAWVALRFLG